MATYRPRSWLLYFGPITWLRLCVWPLGGAKGFSSTLDISVVFEAVAVIFARCGRTPQGLQIPPISEGFPPPVWGSAPPPKFFFGRKFLELCRSPVPKTLHSGPPGGPLGISPTAARGHGLFGGNWGFFSIFGIL